MSLLDLASRHADGTLDEHGYDELNQLLQTDADARTSFIALMRTHALLRQHIEEQAGTEDSGRIASLQAQREQRKRSPRGRRPAPRRRAPARTSAPMLLLVVLGIAGIAAWYVSQQAVTSPRAHYQLSAGDLVGDPITSLPFTVTATSASSLVHRDGSTYQLTAGSQITVSDQGIELERGSMEATVNRQSSAFTFQTSAFTVTVLGTHFTLYAPHANAVREGIELHHGRVRVHHDGQSRELTSGEQWLAPERTPTILLVTGPHHHQGAQLTQIERALQERGWRIIRSEPDDIKDFTDFDLVLLTASIDSDHFNVTNIEHLAIPVVLEELFIAPRLGLSGSVEKRDFGSVDGLLSIADQHPLSDRLPRSLAGQAFPNRLFANPSSEGGRVLMHIDGQAVCTSWPRGAVLADGRRLAGPRATFSLSIADTLDDDVSHALCELIAWMLQ